MLKTWKRTSASTSAGAGARTLALKRKGVGQMGGLGRTITIQAALACAAKLDI